LVRNNGVIPKILKGGAIGIKDCQQPALIPGNVVVRPCRKALWDGCASCGRLEWFGTNNLDG